MAEMTVAEVLRRIDQAAPPRAAFADALLTSLLDELEGSAVIQPGSLQDRASRSERRWSLRLRPARPRRPRWLRVAIAAAVTFLVVVFGVVLIQPQPGRQDALAVMQQARAAFAEIPPFQAAVVKRTAGRWIQAESPQLHRPVPDLVVRRQISYLDPTHFRNTATEVTWDVHGPASAIDQVKVEQGSYWAADGTYFVTYSPVEGTYTVGPIERPNDLAFFAAGELMPGIEYMADPSDAYLQNHCEVLPDETMLGRTVRRIHCTDPEFRQYPGGPTLDLDTWVDAETGMLLRMESRNEGLLFAVTSLDLTTTQTPGDFQLHVPQDASVQWLGDGAPPAPFRPEVDPSVTSIQVGNNPEAVTYGAGSVWVTYTEGGTGGDGEGGRQAVARIDPGTNEVVAKIVAPTQLTEIPKGWVSPLVFVSEVLATDDAVYIAYHDAGNDDRPVHIAAIDTATNELGPPLLTLDRQNGGYYGASMAFDDGALWVCDTQGGGTFPGPGRSDWPLGAVLKVAPATGDELARYPIEGNCGDMVVADGSLWFRGVVPTTGGDMSLALFEVEMATGAVSTYPIPIGSMDVALGNATIWIVDQQRRLLNRFDVGTAQLGEPIDTGLPTGIGDAALAWGQGLLWETNSADNTLRAIDPTTGAVIDTIEVGASPLDVVVAYGSLWVADYRDATVSRVKL